MPLGGALSIGAPIIGGLLGGLFGSSKDQEAIDAINKSYAQAMQTIGDPELAKQVVLQQYKSAGTLTPAMEQYISAGPSAVSQIQENQQGRNAQSQALQALQQVGASGWSAAQRADLNKARMQAQQDAQSKTDQIMQNMAARGQAGSGAELAASLSAAQNAANQQSQAGDQLAASAQQNALQAMMQGGQLGGQLRTTDFDVAQAKAQAADARRQFDIQNQISAQQRNTATQNAGQEYNLQNAQNLSNANISATNQAAEQAKQNQLGLAQTKAGLQMGQGQAQGQVLGQQANATRNMYGQLGSGISTAATGLAKAGVFGAKTPTTNSTNGIKVDDMDGFGNIG